MEFSDFSYTDKGLQSIYHSIDPDTFELFRKSNKMPFDNRSKDVNLYHIVYWLYNQFKPYREVMNSYRKYNGFDVFEKCKTKYTPNCACFAIMMNDILISMGLKSKAVWCLSRDPHDTECHALNHVWIDKEEQWAVVDPSSKSIICNEYGHPIDLMTMRSTIMNNDLVYPHRNKTIRQPIRFIIEYNQYMRKNIFQFITHFEQGLSYPLDETAVLIHPIGFSPKYRKKWKKSTDISYLY